MFEQKTTRNKIFLIKEASEHEVKGRNTNERSLECFSEYC